MQIKQKQKDQKLVHILSVTVSGLLAAVLAIGGLDRQMSSQAIETDTSPLTTFATGGEPRGMALDNSGNLWFTQYAGNSIVKMSPDGEMLMTITLPNADSQPREIISDASGDLWFVEEAGGRIGHLPSSATSVDDLTECATPSITPYDLAFDNRGMLWVVERLAHRLAIFDPSKSCADGWTEIGLSASGATAVSLPTRIILGQDGRMWFTEGKITDPSHIAAIDTAGNITEYTLPGAVRPYAILADSNGYIWVSTQTDHKLVKMDTGGNILASIDLAPTADVRSLVEGADGNIWYADFGAPGKRGVGYVEVENNTNHTLFYGSDGAYGLLYGQNDTIWVSQNITNKIARFELLGLPAANLFEESGMKRGDGIGIDDETKADSAVVVANNSQNSNIGQTNRTTNQTIRNEQDYIVPGVPSTGYR